MLRLSRKRTFIAFVIPSLCLATLLCFLFRPQNERKNGPCRLYSLGQKIKPGTASPAVDSRLPVLRDFFNHMFLSGSLYSQALSISHHGLPLPSQPLLLDFGTSSCLFRNLFSYFALPFFLAIGFSKGLALPVKLLGWTDISLHSYGFYRAPTLAFAITCLSLFILPCLATFHEPDFAQLGYPLPDLGGVGYAFFLSPYRFFRLAFSYFGNYFHSPSLKLFLRF